MLFGAENIDLGALGIPDVTGYREHLYQVTARKIVFPSVNGPIPAVWPTTPRGRHWVLHPQPRPRDHVASSAGSRSLNTR